MYNRHYYKILFEQKKQDLADKASNFLQEHEKLVTYAEVGIAVGAYLGLTVVAPCLYAKHVQNTSFPDLNTGIVWRSSRALNTQERLELERLVWRQGIGVGEVLNQMGLLKH